MTIEIKDKLLDAGSFVPHDDDLVARDPLNFPSYADALKRAGSNEAITCGEARIGAHSVEIGLFDFGFMGGSMSEAVGERLARGLERAARRGVPFVLYTATGGARMQEGMRALVQMPKLVVARATLAAAACPLLVVLGNPTTGGVLASIASLGDVTLAEADATIGFAGPRVAGQVLGRPLSGKTHSAAFAAAAGAVDAVVMADRLRDVLTRVLDVLAPDAPLEVELATQPSGEHVADAWEVVVGARSESRPHAPALAIAAADTHYELRGDRSGSDDPALFVAIARFSGRRALVLALERAHLPGPGAYRKARRALALARRLNLPVVTLIDTRGADPGEESEKGGIAGEIAALFDTLLSVPVPVVSIITGEGGSGGALAFACGDHLVAYAGSFFSVIAPEAAAQILWRDADRAAEAARSLAPTAPDLLRLGIVDEVAADPLEARSLGRVIAYSLRRLQDEALGGGELVSRRRSRWRTRDGY